MNRYHLCNTKKHLFSTYKNWFGLNKTYFILLKFLWHSLESEWQQVFLALMNFWILPSTHYCNDLHAYNCISWKRPLKVLLNMTFLITYNKESHLQLKLNLWLLWFFHDVWVTASLLWSPGLLVFLLILTVLWSGCWRL